MPIIAEQCRDMDGITPQMLYGAPPVMPWENFADWIGMTEEPGVVKAWIDRGYIPKKTIGKRLMVNVALFTRQLLEEE